MKGRRLTTDEFIKKANLVHGTRYDYSKVVYINNKTVVEIICKEHGIFWQIAGNHINDGQMCPSCSKTFMIDTYWKTTDDFIKDAIKVHGGRYDYSKVNYVNTSCNIIIVCKKHGEFIQMPRSHLRGAGCQKCAASHGEGKIMTILNDRNVLYQCQKMFSDCRSPKGRMLKFDFYIPEKNVLIEFDGPQHFGDLKIGKHTLKKEEYERLKVHDKIKNDYTNFRGIKMLRIPYWEFNNIETIISDYL